MRRILLSTLFVLVALTGFAQQKGQITGTIGDQASGEYIPYASISLLLNGQPISNGAISDEQGQFAIRKLAYGNYSAVVSFMGYETQTIPNIVLSKAQPKINLGQVNMALAAVALQEVEVRAMAKTQSVKIDRKSYRAEDFATAKGGTAVDLLNKLPAVSVSPDGAVSVRGTEDFMVYLNGKPTQMEASMLLAQLPGDMIKNVEVISVPTAKYDAQGKGGIINIVTKSKATDGLSLTVNGLGGGAPWGHKTDKYSGYNMNDWRYGGSANLVYGKDKLTLYAGASYNYKNVNGKRAGDARVLDTNTGAYKHMVADGERPEWYENYSAHAGVDYQFTEATVLSAAYNYSSRTEGRSAFYVYHNFYADKDKNPIAGIPSQEEWIYNPNTDNRYGKFHNVNVDLSHQFANNSDIRASFLYENSNLSRNLDNLNYDYSPVSDEVGAVTDHYNQSDDTPLDAWRFSLDYSKEFDNGNVLGMGIQPQYMRINGDFSYDTLDVATGRMLDYTELENGIDLKRGIYAGYIDYAGAWGKLDYMAGLRLEYTDQSLKMDNPDYFSIFDRPTEEEYKVQQLDWFPTIHASYNFGNENKLSLAASRRISRPPVKNMAPFLYRRHLEVYVVGDPALKPEYINTVELGYDQNIGKQNFNITGFYRGVTNAIFRVNTVYEEEMVLIRSYTNSGNTTSLGGEVSTNLVWGDFAKFFIGGSLYNYRVKADIFGYREDNSSLNWSLKGNANFAIAKGLSFTADFNVKSATVTAQGQNDMFYLANAALSYTPQRNKNWNIQLRGLDLLSSNLQGLDTKAHNADGAEIFYQETTYTRQGPILELGVTYTLNKIGKRKKVDGIGTKEF